jgi:hypothetical protein
MAELKPFVPEQPLPVPDLPDYNQYMAAVQGLGPRARAARDAAYGKLRDAHESAVRSNEGIPQRNAIAFKTWKDSYDTLSGAQRSSEQATYDASTREQIMNALRSYGPFVAGGGIGGLVGEGVNSLVTSGINSDAQNLKGAADQLRGYDWNDPANRPRMQGAVETGQRYLPGNPVREGVGVAKRVIGYGVPAAAALYEALNYRRQADDPNLSEGDRNNARVVGNGLIGVGGGIGLEGGGRFMFPYRPDTAQDEATIRGAAAHLNEPPGGSRAGNAPRTIDITPQPVSQQNMLSSAPERAAPGNMMSGPTSEPSPLLRTDIAVRTAKSYLSLQKISALSQGIRKRRRQPRF